MLQLTFSKIPNFNPIAGTFILYQDRLEWFVKYSDGRIQSCSDPEYPKKYINKKYHTVMVNNPDDDAYILSLNRGFYTIVQDKFLIGRPNLLTFENTVEWESITAVKQLSCKTNFFCLMSGNHYNPYLKNQH